MKYKYFLYAEKICRLWNFLSVFPFDTLEQHKYLIYYHPTQSFHLKHLLNI